MGGNSDEILLFLRDSAKGILCILLLVLLLYIVVFWQDVIAGKIFTLIFNLKNASKHQFIKVKNVQFNIFTLKFHVERLLYANEQFSLEIGDLLIKYHFIKHVQIISRAVFQQILTGVAEQLKFPSSPLMVKASGVDIHVYSRKLLSQKQVENAKQRPISLEVPVLFELIPAVNLQVKALRVAVQNEFLRLALVAQIAEIDGVLGIANPSNLVDLYEFTGVFALSKVDVSLYENRGFYYHQRESAKERKEPNENFELGQHKFETKMLNTKFCVKFQIFEAEEVCLELSKDVGARFEEEHLEENLEDDNSPVFHIIVKLQEHERGYCGSLNFGAWYLSELFIFIDFLMPHNYSGEVQTSRIGQRRYSTSIQVAILFMQEFPVCMPYYNEMLEFSPKKADLLVAWKTVLAENIEYYNRMEEEQVQRDFLAGNVDDEEQYKILQKLLLSKKKTSKHSSTHYINYETALPGDILLENSTEECPHPNEYNQYINYLGFIVAADSSLLFRREARYKHESEVMRSGVTVLLKSPLIKVKVSTLKIFCVATSDLELMFGNHVAYLNQPRQTMEIVIVMRDLLVDFSKPFLDAMLHCVNSYAREPTIQTYYQMYDIRLPSCKIDRSILQNKLNRLIYLGVINAEMSCNVQKQHTLSQLEHVTQVPPSSCFEQYAALFSDWVALYDSNREYLEMFTSVQQQFASLLFEDARIAKEQVPQFDIFSEMEHIGIKYFKTRYNAIFEALSEYEKIVQHAESPFEGKQAEGYSLYPRLIFQTGRLEADIVLEREQYVDTVESKKVLDEHIVTDEALMSLSGHEYELKMDMNATEVNMLLEFAQESELNELFSKTQRVENDIVLGQIPRFQFTFGSQTPLAAFELEQQHLLEIGLKLIEPVLLADVLTVELIIDFIFNGFLEFSYPLNIYDICRYAGPNCLIDLLKNSSVGTPQQQGRLSISSQNDSFLEDRIGDLSLTDSLKKNCTQIRLEIDNPLLLVKSIPIGHVGICGRSGFEDSQYYALNCNNIALTIGITAEETLVDCHISPLSLYENIHNCKLHHGYKTQIYNQQQLNSEHYFSLNAAFFQAQQSDHQECRTNRLLSISFIAFRITTIKVCIQQVVSSSYLTLDFDIGNMEFEMQNEHLPRVIQAVENNMVNFGYNRYYSRSAGKMEKYIDKLYANRTMFQCPSILESYLKHAKFIILRVAHADINVSLEKQTPNEELGMHIVIDPAEVEVLFNCSEKGKLEVRCQEDIKICIRSFDKQHEEIYLKTSLSVNLNITNGPSNVYNNAEWKMQHLENSYYLMEAECSSQNSSAYFFPRIYGTAIRIPGDFSLADITTDIGSTFIYTELERHRTINVIPEIVSESSNTLFAINMHFEQIFVRPKIVYALQELLEYVRQCNNVFEMTHIFFNFHSDDFHIMPQFQAFENALRRPLSEYIVRNEPLNVRDINLVESNSLRETNQDIYELELVLQKSLHFGGNYFENRLELPTLRYEARTLELSLVVEGLIIVLESYSHSTSFSLDTLQIAFLERYQTKSIDMDMTELLIKGGDLGLEKTKHLAQKNKLVSRELNLEIKNINTANELLRCNHVFFKLTENPQNSPYKQEASIEIYISELNCVISMHAVSGIREALWDLKHSMLVRDTTIRQYNEKIDAALSSYVFQRSMTQFLFKEYLDLCLDYDLAKNAEFVKNLFSNSAICYEEQRGLLTEPIFSHSFALVANIFREFGISIPEKGPNPRPFIDPEAGYLVVDYQQQAVHFMFGAKAATSSENLIKMGLLRLEFQFYENAKGQANIEIVVNLMNPELFVTDEMIIDVENYISSAKIDSGISNFDELDQARREAMRAHQESNLVQDRNYKEEILVLLKENELSLGRKLMKIINYCNIQLVCRVNEISCLLRIKSTGFLMTLPTIYFSSSSARQEPYPEIVNKIEIPLISCLINDDNKEAGQFSLHKFDLQTQSNMDDGALKTYIFIGISVLQFDLMDFNELFEQFMIVLAFCYGLTVNIQKLESNSGSDALLNNIPQFCVLFKTGELEIKTTILHENKLAFRLRKASLMVNALRNQLHHPLELVYTILETEFEFDAISIDLPRVVARADSSANTDISIGVLVDFPHIFIPLDIIATLSSLQIFFYKYKLEIAKLETNRNSLELRAKSELPKRAKRNRQAFLQTSSLDIKVGIDKSYFSLITPPIRCTITHDGLTLLIKADLHKLLLLQTDKLEVGALDLKREMSHEFVESENGVCIILQDQVPCYLFLEANLSVELCECYGESVEMFIEVDEPQATASLPALQNIQQFCSYFSFIKQSTSSEQQRSIDAIRVELKELENPRSVKDSQVEYRLSSKLLALRFQVDQSTHFDFIAPFAGFFMTYQTKMEVKNEKYFFQNSFALEFMTKAMTFEITQEGEDNSTSHLEVGVKYRLTALEEAKQKYQYCQDILIDNLKLTLEANVIEQVYETILQLTQSTTSTPLLDQKIITNYEISTYEDISATSEENQFCIYFEQADLMKLETNLAIQAFKFDLEGSSLIEFEFPRVELQFIQEKRPYGRIEDYQTQQQYEGIMDLAEQFDIYCFVFYQPFQSISSILIKIHDIDIHIPYSIFEFAQLAIGRIQIADNYKQSHIEHPKANYGFQNMYLTSMKQLQKELRKAYGNEVIISCIFAIENASFALNVASNVLEQYEDIFPVLKVKIRHVEFSFVKDNKRCHFLVYVRSVLVFITECKSAVACEQYYKGLDEYPTFMLPGFFECVGIQLDFGVGWVNDKQRIEPRHLQIDSTSLQFSPLAMQLFSRFHHATKQYFAAMVMHLHAESAEKEVIKKQLSRTQRSIRVAYLIHLRSFSFIVLSTAFSDEISEFEGSAVQEQALEQFVRLKQSGQLCSPFIKLTSVPAESFIMAHAELENDYIEQLNVNASGIKLVINEEASQMIIQMANTLAYVENYIVGMLFVVQSQHMAFKHFESKRLLLELLLQGQHFKFETSGRDNTLCCSTGEINGKISVSLIQVVTRLLQGKIIEYREHWLIGKELLAQTGVFYKIQSDIANSNLSIEELKQELKEDGVSQRKPAALEKKDVASSTLTSQIIESLTQSGQLKLTCLIPLVQLQLTQYSLEDIIMINVRISETQILVQSEVAETGEVQFHKITFFELHQPLALLNNKVKLSIQTVVPSLRIEMLQHDQSLRKSRVSDVLKLNNAIYNIESLNHLSAIVEKGQVLLSQDLAVHAEPGQIVTGENLLIASEMIETLVKDVITFVQAFQKQATSAQLFSRMERKQPREIDGMLVLEECASGALLLSAKLKNIEQLIPTLDILGKCSGFLDIFTKNIKGVSSAIGDGLLKMSQEFIYLAWALDRMGDILSLGIK